MILGGQQVKKYQNAKKIDRSYYSKVADLAREALTELTFVQTKDRQISKTTDSIYCNFKMNHHENVFTLSLRNHSPQIHKENYFYFYVNYYKTPLELKKAIQRELIRYYNVTASKLKIAKCATSYIKQPHSHTNHEKKKTKKSMKGKRWLQRKQKQEVASFMQLMDEINN